MSEISELESRLSAALERIGRGVDAMQAVVAEPEEGEDVQALRRALENEALVTAQMEERVRALTARQTELETELATANEARALAEEAQASVDDVQQASEAALKAAQADAEETKAALLAAEARAEAAETAAAAAADAAEDAAEKAAEAPEVAPVADTAAVEANRELLNELAKRLRRLRQIVRKERTANQVLRHQVEQEEKVDPGAFNEALQADLNTLTALREAEMAETAVILAELRPLLHGEAVDVAVVDEALETEDEAGEA